MASNSDFRLQVGWRSHIKHVTVAERLGLLGNSCWLAMIEYAAEHRTDGNLGKLTDRQLGVVADAKIYLPEFKPEVVGLVLIEEHLVDRVGCRRVVHNWNKWQPWAAKEAARKLEGARNAHKRWCKAPPCEECYELGLLERPDGDPLGTHIGKQRDPHAPLLSSPLPSSPKSPLTPKGERPRVNHSVETLAFRETWNAMSDSVDRVPKKITEARDKAISKAMERPRFRENWRELLRLIEKNGGTPAGWTKRLQVTTVLRDISYPKIMEEEWWEGVKPTTTNTSTAQDEAADTRKRLADLEASRKDMTSG